MKTTNSYRQSLLTAVLLYGAASSLSAQVTDPLDPNCLRSLKRGSHRDARSSASAHVVETTPSHYGLATIRFRLEGEDALYGLYLGDAIGPAYEGNDLGDVARHLATNHPLPKGGSYYVSFDGFLPHKEESALHTMRLRFNDIDPLISLEPIEGSPGEWGGVMLRNVTGVGKAEIYPIAKRPGWFEGKQRIVQETRSVWLRVQARSRSVVERFFALFQSHVEQPRSGDTTLAQIVSRTKADIKSSMNLTDAQLRAAVLNQTGRVLMVDLLVPAQTGD
jgi:hypothetical protein